MLKRIMKLGDTGDDILLLQTKLKEFGYFIDKISGYYNQNTLMSVSNFQKDQLLKTTGEVDMQTWDRITNFNSSKKKDSDIENQILTVTNNGLKIYNISEDVDFYEEETLKDIIVISNSGSCYSPNLVNNYWKPIYQEFNNLLKRSSHFIIGRTINYDGIVIRTFDDRYWSYPFYTKNAKNIISIEISNFGPLVLIDDVFYNLTGNKVSSDEVIEIDFLGYNYYHKYTDKQIDSLRKLLIYLQLKHGIQIQRSSYDENGIIPYYNNDWFYNIDLETKGIKNRNNYINSLFGLTPQKEIIDMLNSI
jgi:hypothetical protein